MYPALFLLLAFPAVGSARDQHFQVTNKEEGLPSPYVRATIIDGSGTLWAALKAPQGVDEWLGLVQIKNAKVVMAFDTASGLRSNQVTALELLSDGTLMAATEKGLHAFDGKSRFIPIGEVKPYQHLGLAPDGTLWMAGEDKNNKGFLARYSRRKLDSFRLPKGLWRIARVIPVSEQKAYVICQNGIARVENGKTKSLSLGKTPLFDPRSKTRDSERRMPPIWLYDGIGIGSETMFLIGATHQIVSFDGTHFSVLEKAHYSRMATASGSNFAIISDFSGNLYKSSEMGIQQIFHLNEGSIGRIHLDSSGQIWMEQEKSQVPHTLLRLVPPYTSPPDRYDLGDGTSLSPGILNIIEDGARGIWLSTNSGLWHLVP